MSLRLLCWLARITKFQKVKIKFCKNYLMKIFRDDIEKIKNIDTRMIKEDRSRFIVDNRDTI